jgi:hypothetical protein
MPTLLSTAYLPPALWVAQAVQSDGLVLEAHESFQKQSYRSRTEIAGPNGKQVLSVPVDRSVKNILQTPLSYKEDWVKNHLRSIETAYANSPFFEVLFPDLEKVLNHRFTTLWELNLATIKLLFHWLEFTVDIEYTRSFESDFNGHDARSLHPKRKMDVEMPAYLQVFADKNGFISNLSALDVFFNLGRSSWDYFQELNLRQK